MGRSSQFPAIVLILVGIALAGFLVLGSRYGTSGEAPRGGRTPATVGPSEPGPLWQGVLGVRALPFLTNERVAIPLHEKSLHPPGTIIAVDGLPVVEKGIPLPGGGFLPFLNGMTYSPQLHRDPRFGPVPPVTAKLVDADGFEWWMHADGSVTTSIYQQITVPGSTYWDSATKHAVAAPRTMVQYTEPSPADPPRPVLGTSAPPLSEVERQLLQLAKQVTEDPSRLSGDR